MAPIAFISSSSPAAIAILIVSSVILIALGIISLEREKRRKAEEALRIANAKLEEKVELQAAELSQTTGNWRLETEKRQKAEQDTRLLLEREREARLQAESANRLKDEFVATISHELRAPLNAILGWSRVLRKSGLDEQAQSKAIETIVRSAENQARLIEDLLDISRITSGKLRLEMRAVDLYSIIDMALETVTPAVEAKKIRLKRDLDPTTGPVSGDGARLQQVIWNLLSNAVKFTPNEGEVSIKLCREESQVLIIVSDKGQGISSEFLPYVFDRFRQADSSSTRKHGGLGLGLSITRHLVELHGGIVTAESAGIGQGATFTVSLPIMQQHISAFRSETSFALSRATASIDVKPILNGLSILIVDDEEDSRQLLIQMLTVYGAKAAAADSAAKAIEMMKEQLPDLLVSDIAMPEEDGYALIRKVRELKFGPNGRLPAIALTAFAQKKDRMRALEAGFQQHFSKPIEAEELAAAIASLTGRRRRSDNGT